MNEGRKAVEVMEALASQSPQWLATALTGCAPEGDGRSVFLEWMCDAPQEVDGDVAYRSAGVAEWTVGPASKDTGGRCLTSVAHGVYTYESNFKPTTWRVGNTIVFHTTNHEGTEIAVVWRF